MADGLHVHPQLMRTPGERNEAQAGGIGFALQHLPFGLGGAAVLIVDFLARLVFPIGGQRQVDQAGIRLDDAGDAGDVGFGGLAMLELTADAAMGAPVERQHQYARSVLVEAVAHAGAGPALPCAILDAVP